MRGAESPSGRVPICFRSACRRQWLRLRPRALLTTAACSPQVAVALPRCGFHVVEAEGVLGCKHLRRSGHSSLYWVGKLLLEDYAFCATLLVTTTLLVGPLWLRRNEVTVLSSCALVPFHDRIWFFWGGALCGLRLVPLVVESHSRVELVCPPRQFTGRRTYPPDASTNALCAIAAEEKAAVGPDVL